MPETRTGRNPKTAALMGGLCVLPFVAANTIVANRIEPLFSLIRPGPHTSAFEYFLLAVVLGFIAVGAFISARPLFDQGARPWLRIYLLNGAVGALMLLMFVVLSVALGSEIYRCDVLGIPNCD
jgi:hypothetical protein